ncbi:MAG: U32 family peptidase [Muribaculaceae bacterium]|nr:U32 family peptidase [Muribaculaceae bacterium]
MIPKKLELLSPASTAESAVQAILHGADAVYIGPPSHGARKSASNSIEDIERVVDFAHQFRAKVYATVNTIIFENEIRQVETLIKDLYTVGVDAIIVQDMGILRMKIPPIALHASTQCDIRTPEKAKFLQDVGFSQLVLARELTLNEIKEIASSVTVPVETFVHGALCVSYSGKCHASLALTGRSANRGECAQICRLPYSLIDSNEKKISDNKYLLSLKDFNAHHNLEDLVAAGVSSFKIEGRLKDVGYIKNITSLYNIQLNKIVRKTPDKYIRSSFGEVSLKFSPKADKSFNRGFTSYFLENRKPIKIASLLSPKSQGEHIRKISDLNNGDGIGFYDKNGCFNGVNVNKIEYGKIIPARKVIIPKGSEIYRTSDIKWDKMIKGETAIRKINLDLTLENNRIKVKDERGVQVILPFDLPFEPAQKPMEYFEIFNKLGNTIYRIKNFVNKIETNRFYRISELNLIKRKMINLLQTANLSTYPYEYRRDEKKVVFPNEHVDYRENIANHLAEEFYREHGVKTIEKAAEISQNLNKGDVVMTTRYCLLRELGICKKEKKKSEQVRFPLYLKYDGGKFRLDFDCKNCEMKVLLD